MSMNRCSPRHNTTMERDLNSQPFRQALSLKLTSQKKILDLQNNGPIESVQQRDFERSSASQLLLGASRKLPGVQPGRVHGVSHLRRPSKEARLRQLRVPVSRQQPAV